MLINWTVGGRTQLRSIQLLCETLYPFLYACDYIGKEVVVEDLTSKGVGDISDLAYCTHCPPPWDKVGATQRRLINMRKKETRHHATTSIGSKENDILPRIIRSSHAL